MANYDVNIAVRAVTKKAEQALKGIERRVKEIRKVTKKGIEWGRSASLRKAVTDLNQLKKSALDTSKAIRGIGERAGFGLLVLGAAKAAKAIREAARNTESFGRSIKFINKETGTSPFKALVDGTSRLTDGFKNLVPGGNKAAAVLGATGKAAKVAAGGIGGLLARIDSLPTAIKAAGVALAAFGPQLPVLANALGDVAGAADKFFGKVPSTQLGKLGKAIRSGLNRPVEELAKGFFKVNDITVKVNKNFMQLGYQLHQQRNSLTALNQIVGAYRTTLEGTHSSEKISIENAKNYATALKAQQKEQKALNELVKQAQGLSVTNRATNKWNLKERQREIQQRGRKWTDRYGMEHDLKNVRSVNQLKQVRVQTERNISQEKFKQYQFQRLELRLAEQRNQAEARKLQLQKRNTMLANMASSGLIGGGFPLLFGQGGSAAVGGGIGGLIGGAMGGGFGFGVSVVGTAIGQWMEDDAKFQKSLGEIDALMLSLGNSTLYTGKQLKDLSKSMGGSIDDVKAVISKFALRQPGLAEDIGKFFGPKSRFTDRFTGAAGATSQQQLKTALSSMIDDMPRELYKEVEALIEGNKLYEARAKLLQEIFYIGSNTRKQEIIRNQSSLGRRMQESTKLFLPGITAHKYKTTDQRIDEQLTTLGQARMSLQRMLNTIIGREQERTGLLDNAQLEETKTLLTDIDNLLKTSRETVNGASAKYEERLEYERRYRELIANGSTPALAKQILQLEKESKAYDEIIDKEVAKLKIQLELFQTKALEMERLGVENELYGEILKKIEKIKELQDETEGKKGKYPGKPKTPGDTIQDEITRIQGALNELTDPAKRLIAIANGVGNAFAESFKGIANGSMTAREALANFTQRVASMFLDMAAQIAANQIALSILKAFGGAVAGSFGGGGGGGGGSFAGVDNATLDSVIGPPGKYNYAEGGYVQGPTNALIGEGGEGEYVIPESKMSDALANYAGGSRGESVIPGDGATGEVGGASGGGVGGSIDVRFTSEVINDVSYVTYAQFEEGVQKAAAEGAKRGEMSTLRRLQNSPSTRNKVGIR